MSGHDHLVRIDRENSRLTIYRAFPDGRLDLYTSIDLPAGPAGDDESFARQLGENILIDTPEGRRLLALAVPEEASL